MSVSDLQQKQSGISKSQIAYWATIGLAAVGAASLAWVYGDEIKAGLSSFASWLGIQWPTMEGNARQTAISLKEMGASVAATPNADPVSLGLQNINNYQMVLSQNPPERYFAECAPQCFDALIPSGQQWVKMSDPASWINLEYDICEKSMNSTCIGYLGHAGVTFTPPNIAKLTKALNGTAALGPYQAGKPFTLSFTPDSVLFPKPSSYSGVGMRGINLAGAEFDSGPNPPAVADALYFVKKGMNTVRLPFKWEYLQPDLTQAIDFTSGYGKQLADSTKAWTDANVTVIFDMHNYMRRDVNKISQIIGAPGSPVTTTHYANAWGMIAAKFKSFSRVLLDLMNEPNTMQTEQILTNYNAAITSIRAAGFNGTILLEGNAWSNLNSWSDNWYGTPNGQIFTPANIMDPLKNFALNVHEYFTSPTGGGDGMGECVDPNNLLTIENFMSFIKWMKNTAVKVFLTELGGIATPNCVKDIDIFLSNVEANPSNSSQIGGFIGWTLWTAGKAWLGTSYPMYLGPNPNGTDTMQMAEAVVKHLVAPAA